jgi:hypothetical protein
MNSDDIQRKLVKTEILKSSSWVWWCMSVIPAIREAVVQAKAQEPM